MPTVKISATGSQAPNRAHRAPIMADVVIAHHAAFPAQWITPTHASTTPHAPKSMATARVLMATAKRERPALIRIRAIRTADAMPMVRRKPIANRVRRAKHGQRVKRGQRAKPDHHARRVHPVKHGHHARPHSMPTVQRLSAHRMMDVHATAIAAAGVRVQKAAGLQVVRPRAARRPQRPAAVNSAHRNTP